MDSKTTLQPDKLSQKLPLHEDDKIKGDDDDGYRDPYDEDDPDEITS